MRELITTDGVKLCYEAVGDGPTLLILGGGPGLNVAYMAPLAELLADRFRCVLLHQRGTGLSSQVLRDESITQAHCVGDIDAVRRDLGVDRIAVLGHSWGGRLAMAYAAEHAQQVSVLVFLGSAGPQAQYMDPFMANLAARLTPEDLALYRSLLTDACGAPADSSGLHDALAVIAPIYVSDQSNTPLLMRSLPRDGNSVRICFLLMAETLAEDLTPRLAAVRCPALVLQDPNDPIGRESGEAIHAALTESTLRFLEGCGHLPWIEKPNETVAAIDTCLSRIRS